MAVYKVKRFSRFSSVKERLYAVTTLGKLVRKGASAGVKNPGVAIGQIGVGGLNWGVAVPAVSSIAPGFAPIYMGLPVASTSSAILAKGWNKIAPKKVRVNLRRASRQMMRNPIEYERHGLNVPIMTKVGSGIETGVDKTIGKAVNPVIKKISPSIKETSSKISNTLGNIKSKIKSISLHRGQQQQLVAV